MGIRARRLLAALCVAAMLVATSTSAFAEEGHAMKAIKGADHVSATADVLLLRPFGFISLVTGIALFAVSTPLVLITRPMEIGKPFKLLVVAPAKYVWSDPLGSH